MTTTAASAFSVFKRSILGAFTPEADTHTYIKLLDEKEPDSVEGKFSMLADGTQIPRAYADETLERKRVEAINKIGDKWLLHPSRHVKRGAYSEVLVSKVTRQDYFLTNYFDKIRSSQVQQQVQPQMQQETVNG